MSNCDFKVGDLVVIYKTEDEPSPEYSGKIGKVGRICDLGNAIGGKVATVKYKDNNILRPYIKNIKLADKIIKKSDLKNGDIVTYRNGGKRIVRLKDKSIVMLDDFSILSFNLDDFYEDLSFSKNVESSFDIVKVYRPETEETFITQRSEDAREMTISEISEALGYEVKIIKEDK